VSDRRPSLLQRIDAAADRSGSRGLCRLGCDTSRPRCSCLQSAEISVQSRRRPGYGRRSTYIHRTRATDSFLLMVRMPKDVGITYSARTAESESRVLFVLDLNQGVQHHRTGCAAVSFETKRAKDDLLLFKSSWYFCIRGFSSGLSGSQRYM